jgi:hypothetical protein
MAHRSSPSGCRVHLHYQHELDDACDAGKRPYSHQRADQDALHRRPVKVPKKRHGRNQEEHVVDDVEACPGDGNPAYHLRVGAVVAVVGQIPPVAQRPADGQPEDGKGDGEVDLDGDKRVEQDLPGDRRLEVQGVNAADVRTPLITYDEMAMDKKESSVARAASSSNKTRVVVTILI